MNPADVQLLELSEDERGTRLRLRVRAAGRENAVLGIHAGALKISVTVAPEKGKANRALRTLLARTLGVPVSSIGLLAGHGSPLKTVHVGLGADELRERLASALA